MNRGRKTTRGYFVGFTGWRFPQNFRNVAALVVAFATMSVGSSLPSQAQANPEWLVTLNQYRAVAGVGPVVNAAEASNAAALHSRYMVQHRLLSHSEDATRAGFSVEGDRAGRTGNIVLGSGAAKSDKWLIENWMTGPFHGVGMIQPRSVRFGFGSAQDETGWAGTLSLLWDSYGSSPSTVNVKALIASAVKAVVDKFPELAGKGHKAKSDGTTVTVTISGRVYTVRDGVVTEGTVAAPSAKATVVWPGPNSAVPLLEFRGPEFPNPLTSCPGFSAPTGVPIYISRGVATEVETATLQTSQGTGIALCVLSASTYRNANGGEEQFGRSVLKGYGAVVLIPQTPLTSGSVYQVAVKLRDATSLSWSFTTTDGEVRVATSLLK